MYQWRKLIEDERKALLVHRRECGHPMHSPPHYVGESGYYHLSAACYEHKPWIGISPQRMTDFSHALVDILLALGASCDAWCVLPNHYHVLVKTEDLERTIGELGHLHGRASYFWNGVEGRRGRKVWCSPSNRIIRSERHYWATMNYVHHNAVHHGYSEKWQEWPYTSAHEYLETIGEEEAIRQWKEYPILDYGKGWDDPAV